MAGDRFGLLVASSEFQNESLRRLRGPPADVEALADVLRRNDVGGFDIKTLVNQPRAIVEPAIHEFFLERKRDDLVLLYFSGHGLKNESNNLYFAVTDTKRRFLESTAVSSRFIHEIMQTCSAKRQVLLLDCCFSGAFPRGCTFRADETIGSGQYFNVQGSGQAILTASDDMQYAFEGDEVTSEKVTPSIFTEIVVEGIASGAADTDFDGNITFDDLHAYLLEQLRARNSRQNPQKWYFGLTGDIVLATNPNPGIRVLAEELRARVESQDVRVRVGAVIDLGALAHKSQGRPRIAAIRALEALAKDDSRRISDAAKRELDELGQVQESVGQTRGEADGEKKNAEVQEPPITVALPSPGSAANPTPEIKAPLTKARDASRRSSMRTTENFSRALFAVVIVGILYEFVVVWRPFNWQHWSLWLAILAYLGLPSFVMISSLFDYPNRRIFEVVGSVIAATISVGLAVWAEISYNFFTGRWWAYFQYFSVGATILLTLAAILKFRVLKSRRLRPTDQPA